MIKVTLKYDSNINLWTNPTISSSIHFSFNIATKFRWKHWLCIFVLFAPFCADLQFSSHVSTWWKWGLSFSLFFHHRKDLLFIYSPIANIRGGYVNVWHDSSIEGKRYAYQAYCQWSVRWFSIWIFNSSSSCRKIWMVSSISYPTFASLQ